MPHPESKLAKNVRLTIFTLTSQCVYDGFHDTWLGAKRFLTKIEKTGKVPLAKRPCSFGCMAETYPAGTKLEYVMTAKHPSKPGKSLMKRSFLTVWSFGDHLKKAIKDERRDPSCKREP